MDMSSRAVMTIAVLIASVGGAAMGEPRESKTHTVTIEGMRFHPLVLTAAPGDTVVWINKDVVPHTVTASAGLDSGTIDAGQSWRYTAGKKTGEIGYVCTFHPTMKATLRIR
jgi:plastocyanin